MTVENQVVLKADEGKLLTNGETFAKVAYLGKNDSADNWHEITQEEYEKMIDESEETQYGK